MYNVSTDYKSQIQQTIRNLSYIRVNLGIVDPDAFSNNAISDNGSLFYSDSNDVDMGRVVQKRYMSFEHNRMILDGNGLLPPSIGNDAPYYQGFVSNEISNSDGTFVTNPKLTIDFTLPFKFIGLTFCFDKILGCYASELQIIAYSDGVEVYNSIQNHTDVEFMLETPIPASGTCNKIEIIFTKTYPVKRRVSLEYIMFGIVKTFTDETITNADWNRSIDLLSTKLSVNTFQFTSIDINKDYNPDNATGFWQYIEKHQPVSFEYGYELNDGTIEWVQGGSLVTDEDITVDSNNSISQITFSATSRLSQLTDSYYKGVYNAIPVSLYNLSIDVFTFANLPLLSDGGIPYYVDVALQNIYTSIPIPELPINQVLQLIANAGRCVLYVDRAGKIVIKRTDETLQDFALTFDNMLSTPKVSKLPALISVNTNYTAIKVTPIEESLSKAESLNFATEIECRFQYDEATECRVVLSGTLAIVGEPLFYAKSCVVTLIGSGTVEILGKKLTRVTTGVTYQLGTVGYSCPIENGLINTQQDAIDYAAWVASILTRRNQYTVSDRGFPEIDVLDVVNTDTLFTTGLQSTLTSSKIRYNGTLSAETTFISKEVS